MVCMLDWQEIVEEYIIKHSNRIQKVTKPLRELFGVTYCTYHRIDRDGKYTVLLDRPDWAEHYVSKKFYLTDPFLRNPDVYQSGACFIESFGTPEYKESVLKSGKTFFKADTAILLIDKQEDGVSFFGVTGDNSSCDLRKLSLNHLPILQAFHAHFASELDTILQEMQQGAAPLSNLKGKDYFCKTPIRPTIAPEAHRQLLKSLGLADYYEKAHLLTKRERDCLKLLLDGKSIKETASLLSLSYRTVEHYYENIKAKIGVHTRSALFTFARKLQSLSLLE